MLRLDHDIGEAILNSNHLQGVFFDLEKAYVFTRRTDILLKLNSFVRRTQLLQFIIQLLTSKTICVRCTSVLSYPFILDEGVPQGCILSV